MNTERCIVCGTPHNNKHLYCDDSCVWLDIRHGLKAMTKWKNREVQYGVDEATTELGRRLFGEEFDGEIVAEGSGCVYKEDYAYWDVAAENCRNL